MTTLQALEGGTGTPGSTGTPGTPTTTDARAASRAPSALASPGVILAAVYLAAVVVSALAPALLAPNDPLAVHAELTLLPPSPAHPLGTDESGRDLLSRMIYGAGPSLLMGLGATAIGVTGGSVLGLLAGLGNRFVEVVVMRFLDIGLAFPELLLALVVITFGGRSTFDALLAVGVASIPSYARLVRAQILTVRGTPYVEAAYSLGYGRAAVIRRHILPNALKPLIVLATIGVGSAIAAGASLSFLGLGSQPPSPEWGAILATGRNFIGRAWWEVLFPAVAITLTVIAVTVIGRAVSRHLEGRTR